MAFKAWTNDEIDLGMLAASVNTNPGALGLGIDGTIVKKCIRVDNSNEGFHIDLLTDAWGAAAVGSWRYQFSVTHSGAPYQNAAMLIGFSNYTDGRDLFAILGAGSGLGFSDSYQAAYWNGTAWVRFGMPFTLPGGAVSVVTVTGSIADSGGIYRIDVGGVMMAQMLGDTKLTASTQIDRIRHFGPGSPNGLTVNYIMEMIFCDDTASMTFGLRVGDLALTGAGTNGTQASGVTTDVNDVPGSTATAMAFDAVGQKYTGVATDLPAAMATSPILGVRISALLRRGSTGPQTWKAALQLAGGYYTSPARSINGVGYTPVAYPFFINPDTGLPWTYAGVNGMEYGGEAAA